LTNLTTLNGAAGLAAKYDYTVAPTGHRRTAAENVVITNIVRTINRVYTYDATYRLINESLSATGPVSLPSSASVGYPLDDVGNRLARTTSGFSSGTLDSATHTFDSDDRLTSDTYDANGNTTAGHVLPGSSTVNDAYDFEDRLINRNSGQIAITYDGDGNRVAKTVGGITTLFLVDDRNPTGYAQVLEGLITTNTQTPALVRAYTYGTDLISQDQLLDNGLGGFAWNVSFYGYDGHGNVRYLTDTNSAVTDTYDYDAFGTLIAHSGTTPNNYLYCGEQFDADLGLYYNRARYLNADSGRFWTRDTFEGNKYNPASLHEYFYVLANPIAFADPSGREDLTVGGVVFTSEIMGEEDKQEVQKARNGYRQARRSLCKIGKMGILNAHHVVPLFAGGLDITENIPQGPHIQLHQMLHYLLKFLQLGGGKVSSDEYESLFSEPGGEKERALVLLAVRAVATEFDAACVPQGVSPITPQIEAQIAQGDWSF
jgi:RHS repeat-associated protein